MIIKISIRIGLAAITILTTHNAEARNQNARLFNGYSIGANAGVLLDQNRLGVTHIDGVSLKFKGKSSAMGYLGIQGDFEMSRPNDLYGALGISLNLPTTTSKSGTKSFPNVNATLLSTGFTLNSMSLKYKVRQGINGDFTFAAGYNFCNQSVLYVLAGFRLSSKKHKLKFVETVTDLVPLTTITTYVIGKKKKAAPILGAGFKTKVASKITVGLDYKYCYKTHDLKYKISAPVISGKIKSHDHAVLARASFHFYCL